MSRKLASFFDFGGASSHDIDGEILEPDDPDLIWEQMSI